MPIALLVRSQIIEQRLRSILRPFQELDEFFLGPLDIAGNGAGLFFSIRR